MTVFLGRARYVRTPAAPQLPWTESCLRTGGRCPG